MPVAPPRPRHELAASIVAIAAIPAAVACGGQERTTPVPASAAPAGVSGSASTPPTQPPPATRAHVAQLLQTVSVDPSSHNLIKNPTFSGKRSLPWMASFTRPAEGEASVDSDAYCVDVTNAGANAWDAQFRHREMTIEKGHAYSIRFKVASTLPTSALVKIGMSGPPYKAYWQMRVDADATPKVVRSEFTMGETDDPTAELAFHIGGKAAAPVPYGICVDDVVLEDPSFTPKPEPEPAPVARVLVNQMGYPPGMRKIAIVRVDATAPVRWELFDKAHHAVASGDTSVFGADAASGDRVHAADFSRYTAPGDGYTIRAGDEVSHPFEIGRHVYRALKYDALHYFYHSRSGTPITMPYAGDPKWTRPPGHPGDKKVECAPDAHCDDVLDVSGGWYDAGDHGKYVVNGGIAVWTLMNLYERAKYLGTSVADFGDGKMNIPENHNGMPDLLDEARWELDFLMKMQVPEGKPLSGMVHHKIHDREWTGLATRPDQDPIVRYLRPVSTAATLNLAATAAQCARIWRGIDAAFSARCLAAAERAWAAAVANPALYASAADGTGGGAYDDDDVSDEFYWAACELYLTTKKDAYKEFFVKSPHRDPRAAGNDTAALEPTWRQVAILGTISLGVVPSGVATAELSQARKTVVTAGAAFADNVEKEGYRVGFRPDASGKYPWGSNSNILNDALLMALAYDFTKEARYLDAVEDSLSYILGRNPMDQSYVTGYGFRPLSNPHHRFWAHQANAAFPGPPPGVLSGGPNSGLQDPYVKAAGLEGCAPMKCFVDDIEAWSANEEAINWNAPLAWVASFLDERSVAVAPTTVAARPVR